MRSELFDIVQNQSNHIPSTGMLVYDKLFAFITVLITVICLSRIFVSSGIYLCYFLFYLSRSRSGLNAEQAIRLTLDSNGMKNTKIKNCSGIRWLVFGNSYSPSKNVFYMRKRARKKKNTVVIALLLFKLGYAFTADYHRYSAINMLKRAFAASPFRSLLIQAIGWIILGAVNSNNKIYLDFISYLVLIMLILVLVSIIAGNILEYLSFCKINALAFRYAKDKQKRIIKKMFYVYFAVSRLLSNLSRARRSQGAVRKPRSHGRL